MQSDYRLEGLKSAQLTGSESGLHSGQDLYSRCPLLAVLVNKERSLDLTPAEWDLVIRQARRLDLLATLYTRLQDIRDQLPPEPVKHMRWAHKVSLRHQQFMSNEVNQLAQSLAPLKQPLVLLKGVAYQEAGLAPAAGRVFSDIDILLPQTVLNEAEILLERAGWLSTHMDDYDQHYYREWMHELPPLRHGQRQTELDVHHAIVPLTARVNPSSKAMLQSVVEIDKARNLFRLSDEDMILHSATHLFLDGEFQHGLRDLLDIDGLLRTFCRTEDAWHKLLNRAEKLDLVVPLYYALHYCKAWLKTPIPGSIDLQQRYPGTWLRRRIMLTVLDRGLLPDHHSCDQWTTPLARFSLFLRSHYVKMPLYLLVPHLTYKSCIGPLKKMLLGLRRQEKASTLDKILAEKKTTV